MKRVAIVLMGLAVLLIPGIASAHVIVTPNTAKVGQYVTFSVSVPNEKAVDVTGLKLTIPDGVIDATPTVKPGWIITTDKAGDGEAAVVHSITWGGGAIPAGQRDDFSFQAQVPAKAAELDWKAYQTYADGTTVSWDQKPINGNDDATGDSGPYSVTKVVDDLKDADATTANTSSMNTILPTALAAVALLVAIIAIVKKSTTSAA